MTDAVAAVFNGIGEVVTRLAVEMWTHPVEVLFTGLMTAALAIVGRRRKLGWCLGLVAQTVILGYGVATDNAGYYPAGVAVVIYLRNLWLRRGESWRAIPTARELARRGCQCTTCCVHGTPMVTTPEGPMVTAPEGPMVTAPEGPMVTAPEAPGPRIEAMSGGEHQVR